MTISQKKVTKTSTRKQYLLRDEINDEILSITVMLRIMGSTQKLNSLGRLNNYELLTETFRFSRYDTVQFV